MEFKGNVKRRISLNDSCLTALRLLKWKRSLEKLFRSKFAKKLIKATSGVDWNSSILSKQLLSDRCGREVDKLLTSLYSNLTDQQCLYDTRELDRILPALRSIFSLYVNKDVFSKKALLVLCKLIAHEAYGSDQQHLFAVQMLLNADQMAEDMPDANSAWYRVFLLDHAVNRMLPTSMRCFGENQRYLLATRRKKLIEEIENLLPSTLKTTEETFLNSEPLLLRAAHYWGHRGNHRLAKAQAIKKISIEQDEVTLENELVAPKGDTKIQLSQLVQGLEEGVHFYQRAAEFRIRAYSNSFEATEEIASLFASLRINTSTSSTQGEKFGYKVQALSDIANQFSAQCCLLCHLAVFPQEVLSLNAVFDRIKRSQQIAELLWKNANMIVRSNGGDLVRTMSWRRLYEHMVFKINKSIGRPQNFYEEKLKDFERTILTRFESLLDNEQ